MTAEDPYKVTCEHLADGQSELTCFFFRHGANFYVFSYEEGGSRRHTFIDTGDPRYRERILSILRDHNINVRNIERIIITHRHHDHCGLSDLLAQVSGAKILVHFNFRNFVEGPLSEADRLWLRGFEPARLRQFRVEYLSPAEGYPQVRINGLDFPSLAAPIPIGKAGRLEIMACPESPVRHSPDQIIIHYIPEAGRNDNDGIQEAGRPADHILFSGDLWLMHGPLFSKSFRALSLRVRLASRQLKGVMSGQRPPRRDPRLQDTPAKEALKHGFSLVRVMPGHGEEFLGSRVIPLSFLCDRDLLVELGYDLDEKKSVLMSEGLGQKVKALKEKAYDGFIKELLLWKAHGYADREISDFLTRIYREQEGGGPLVKEDRKERRQRIKEALTRLSGEERPDHDLKALAQSTLRQIQNL